MPRGERQHGQLISRRTRTRFREAMVGLLVLRTIDEAFQDENFKADPKPLREVNGQRRTLIEQYYAAIDFGDRAQVLRLLRVYETLLPDMRKASADGYAEVVRFLKDDGFAVADNGITPAMGTSSLLDLRTLAEGDGAAHLATTIRRIEASIETDPGLAIGSAKELVESVAKTILTERGETFDAKADLAPLVKSVLKALALSTEDVPDAVKGAETTKRLLMNLATVVQGLAELRNLYGTGHGRDGKWKGVGPRHARLVVNSATTLVVFLLDTHRERPVDTASGR